MKTRSCLGAAGLVIAGAIAGCAGNSQYVYQPNTANATAAGLPAASTPIPQEAPQGAIEVVSYGVADLKRDGTTIPSLHVRAIVHNDGDATPWTMDTSQQLVEIPGEGKSRAIFVNADVNTLPNVTIARGERRVVDMYFPLPDTMHKASQLPRFDLLWQVHTGARVVASRTSFERVDREPDTEVVATAGWPLWAGWGPYWWYDPFYPRVVFIHARPYPHFQGSGRVIVGGFGGRFHAGHGRVVGVRR